MAVAQGYGKTVTSGSVFAYDVADTRNSYIGEPTTNAISSASTMASWTNYYRTVASSTFTTEFGTTGYRFVNQPSWNGVYRNFNLVNTGYHTFSAWFKYNGGSAANNGATVYISNYGGGDTLAALDKNLIGVWQRVSFTVNVTSPSNVYFYLISYGGTDNGTGSPDFSSWEVTMPQIELNSHATPFVNGTRSATQGLLPLVGNSTINLSNVSFDSNAKMVFDGTNDYVSLGASSNWAFGGNGTVELMVKPTDSTGNNRLWCVDSNSTSLDAFLDTTSYKIFLHGGVVGALTTLTQNAWNHVVVTYTGGTVQIYINGTPATMDGTTTGYSMSNSGTLYLGCDINLTYNLYGEIPIFKTYNRALTTSEIKQNFRHYRTRFGMEYDTFYFAVSNRITKYNRRWAEQEAEYDEEDNFIGYIIIAEGEISGENMATTTPAYTIYRKPDTSFQNPGEYTEVASDNIGTPARLTEYGVQTKYSSGKWLTTVTVSKNNVTGELSFEFPDGNTDTYGEAFYKTIITPYVP